MVMFDFLDNMEMFQILGNIAPFNFLNGGLLVPTSNSPIQEIDSSKQQEAEIGRLNIKAQIAASENKVSIDLKFCYAICYIANT